VLGIPYKPHLIQSAFHFSGAKFRAFIGGIGSGKTLAGVQEVIRACGRYPGSRGMIVAPTYRMLRDATRWEFLRVCAQVPGLLTEFKESANEATLVTGGTILFRSADEPDRLRGPNLGFFYLDEAALMSEQAWYITIGRLREKPALGWITTTPKGRNWVWREFAAEAREGYEVFRATTADNPYLAHEFVSSLEMAYTGNFAKQELLGEFVAFEGLVYEEFSRAVHIGSAPAQFSQVVAGVDWGYTNPAVILVIGLDSDKRAYVVHEFYKRQILIGDMVIEADKLADQYKITAFYCDPSEPGNIAQMRRANLNALPADNTVTPGIQAVKARLAVQKDGRPRLMIAPQCVNLAAEFESYCWRQGKAGLTKDEPEKIGDHAVDGLRYALMGVDKRIKLLG